MSFFITLIIHLILSSDSSSASISSVIGWKIMNNILPSSETSQLFAPLWAFCAM